jgi:hypothetical protein
MAPSKWAFVGRSVWDRPGEGRAKKTGGLSASGYQSGLPRELVGGMEARATATVDLSSVTPFEHYMLRKAERMDTTPSTFVNKKNPLNYI